MASETVNSEFPIDVLYVCSFLVMVDVVCLLLKTVKPMLYLGNVVLLRYVLIYTSRSQSIIR